MIALAGVIDSEIYYPITGLNMMSPEDVTTGGSSVSVKILLVTTECPLRNTITADAGSAFGAFKGVKDITMEMGVMNDGWEEALRGKPNGGRPEKEISFA